MTSSVAFSACTTRINQHHNRRADQHLLQLNLLFLGLPGGNREMVTRKQENPLEITSRGFLLAEGK